MQWLLVLCVCFWQFDRINSVHIFHFFAARTQRKVSKANIKNINLIIFFLKSFIIFFMHILRSIYISSITLLKTDNNISYFKYMYTVIANIYEFESVESIWYEKKTVSVILHLRNQYINKYFRHESDWIRVSD